MSRRMRRLLITCLIFVSVFRATTLHAQHTFPIYEGEKVKYNAMIQMPNAYISGVCVLLNESGVIKGCMFNEFGITMLDFTFSPDKQKVKLNHVIKIMDKWYIKRLLRKDLVLLMSSLQKGESEYYNEHRKITYQFIPIPHEIVE